MDKIQEIENKIKLEENLYKKVKMVVALNKIKREMEKEKDEGINQLNTSNRITATE